MDTRALRFPRQLIVIGYLMAAVSTVMQWWPRPGIGYISKTVTAYDLSLLIGSILFGWGWWLCMPVLSTTKSAHTQLRLALRIFALANGVLAVGRLVEVRAAYGSLQRASVIVCALGLGVVSIGFWMASRGVEEVDGSAEIITAEVSDSSF